MAVEVQAVFDQAMGLMDELSAAGQARTADTKEYEYRTPAILNALIAEVKLLLGDRKAWMPVESMEDMLPLDSNYALGAMSYGLAAKLLVDENPTTASFYHQKYEEARNLYLRSRPVQSGEIENLYGHNEHGQFGRW